jgi:RNA recognition motif-containing protein
MSIRLYIGNLPKELEKQELETIFADFGESASTKVITDRKTGKCRGFGFVTVKNDEVADQFIEKFNGYTFKDTSLKIEKALPRSKGKAEEDEQDVQPVVAAGGRRKSASKGRRSDSTSVSSTSDAAQPDPRWAKQLEQLKELLATQTANS